MPLNPLTWFTGGWQGYAAVAVVAAGISAVATSMPYRLTISNMEKGWALAQRDGYKDALDQFSTDAALIHQSAADYTDFKQDLAEKFAAASKDLSHAVKARPLSPDCKPDDGRVRALSAAITATNTASGSKPRPAVSPNP